MDYKNNYVITQRDFLAQQDVDIVDYRSNTNHIVAHSILGNLNHMSYSGIGIQENGRSVSPLEHLHDNTVTNKLDISLHE